MSPLPRREWLKLSAWGGFVGLIRSARSADRHSTTAGTVDANLREALDTAPLSMRFRGTTHGEFETWQSAFRDQLLRLLGPSEPPAEWSEVVESQTEFDDHVRSELLLQSPGTPDLPVYLLLPRGDAQSPPRPAMLCLHGHGEFGHHPIVGRVDLPGVAEAIAASHYDYGMQFVRRGYVVVAPCLIPFGRRIDREQYDENDPCAITFLRMQALGRLLITENLRDCRWAISLLARRPEVDSTRIGCAGLSYGGRMSMLTAALDDRIRIAVVSGALNLQQERLQGRYSCGSQIIPGLLQFGDHPEIGGLIAPRSAIWEVGRNDRLIREPFASDFRRRLQSIYDAAGASQQLMFDDFDGGHRWNGEVAFRAVREMLKP